MLKLLPSNHIFITCLIDVILKKEPLKGNQANKIKSKNQNMKTTYFLVILFFATVESHSKHRTAEVKVTRKERFLDFLFNRSKQVRPNSSKPLDTKFIKAEPPESRISHIEQGMFLTFNIDSIPRDKLLIRSGLNIFQTSLRNVYQSVPGKYKITILEKVSSWFHPEKLRSLAFQVVTPNYNGWRNFNITKATKQWLRRKQTQLNITIIVQSPSGDYLIPDLFGIYGVESDSNEYIPFMSVFSV